LGAWLYNPNHTDDMRIPHGFAHGFTSAVVSVGAGNGKSSELVRERPAPVSLGRKVAENER